MWVLVSTMIFTSSIVPNDDIPLNYVAVYDNLSECEEELERIVNSNSREEVKELRFDIKKERVLIVKESDTITYHRCKEDLNNLR